MEHPMLFGLYVIGVCVWFVWYRRGKHGVRDEKTCANCKFCSYDVCMFGPNRQIETKAGRTCDLHVQDRGWL